MIVSGALHAALLAMILVSFAAAPKFDDAAESVPVDTITQSQFNEIMKGDKSGKPAKAPIEKPAPKPLEATAPTPPAEPAKVEPPVLRHIDDPGQDREDGADQQHPGGSAQRRHATSVHNLRA